MGPSLFEIAIRITPRIRAWMFSSVMSGGRPANRGSSIAAKPSTPGSIGTLSRRMPSASATAFASSVLAAEV